MTADHSSVSGDAELDDLQFMADQEGITLEESIARYAWGDDFSVTVGAIRDNDASSVAATANSARRTTAARAPPRSSPCRTSWQNSNPLLPTPEPPWPGHAATRSSATRPDNTPTG